MKIDQIAKPGNTQSIEIDGPYVSSIDLRNVSMAESMAFGCGGSSVQYRCPSPQHYKYGVTTDPFKYKTAPWAVMTGVKTWTDFNFDRGFTNTSPFQLPYRFTENFNRIVGIAEIVTSTQRKFSLRLVEKTLVTAVTTTYGEPSLGAFPREPLVMMNWKFLNQPGGKQYVASTHKLLLSPDVSVSRGFSIGVQCYMDEISYPPFYAGYAAGAYTVNVMLMSLTLVDSLTFSENASY